MKKTIIAGLALALAASLSAQTAAPAAQAPGDKVVATINGEVITRAKLDFLYDRMGAQMRAQYEKSGGRTAFLENYLRKRLVIQEALKSGFEQRPNVKAEMDAARESAMFDLYVRDVLSETIVTDEAMRVFYDQNREQFATPERAKVRHIVISATDAGPRPKTKEQARQMIAVIAAELMPYRPEVGAAPNVVEAFRNRFGAAARQYSEDGVAQQGGDLGWVEREGLDVQFSTAAFSLPAGTMSDVVESAFGYHLIFTEEMQPAAYEPYEKARTTVRELVMRQKAAEVMANLNRLTNELRQTSRISIHPENMQ
ncbi:MAG: peptidylprolyl isomerase [Thermoanaerobaculia bacterium]